VHENGSPKDTDGNLSVGIFLTNPSLRVSFFDATPMATANADFDPFYLRHVSFYLIMYSISHLLTDTSKNERNLLKAYSNINDFPALDTLASMATSSSNSSIPMAVCVTPTTRTTAMTVLSVKRVCKCFALANTLLMLRLMKCGLVRWW